MSDLFTFLIVLIVALILFSRDNQSQNPCNPIASIKKEV